MILTRLAFLIAVASAGDICETSDANLLYRRKMVCNSLVQASTSFCKDDWQNVSASKDWPSQTVYFYQLLDALAAHGTCLNTSYAQETLTWINSSMADPSIAGNFMWTWLVFQEQYFDMPRKPGVRIESPDTLGRKCWGFAYFTQHWDSLQPLLGKKLNDEGGGANLFGFNDSYRRATQETASPTGLCQRVICNCFQNASYDPSRSGSCKVDVGEFHYLGFDREALSHGGNVQYTWHEHCSNKTTDNTSTAV